MPDGTYGIRGLPRPSDAIAKTKTIPFVPNLPLRHEISTLAGSRDPRAQKQWTLFVLGLERFKSKPIDHKLSYFRVAGLHGFPGQPWDNAPTPGANTSSKTTEENRSFDGYCNHNGLNFPTWHRPYMVLFEQCVWDNMKAIISQWVIEYGLSYREAMDWQVEANRWRMPYWDWAKRQTYAEDLVYPEVLVKDRIPIYPPISLKDYYPSDGLYINPLSGFENPEKDEHGSPRPLGEMPPGKEKWNIPDNPPVHKDSLPEIDAEDGQWFPWSKTSATSRYGLRLSQDGDGFTGLKGLNNVRQANEILSNFGKENLWYEPRKDEKGEDPVQPKAETGGTSTAPSAWWNPGTLADAVSRMLSPRYNSSWEQVASTKWYGESGPDDRSGYLSMEYIHNNVHNIAGGASWKDGLGHLGDVPVAAFDPLFWLHHCQMDRLLAIWQSLYWDLWWDRSPNHFIADGPKAHLQPFHTKDNGDPKKDVWTAEMCRDWTHLNYQYDDLWSVSQRTLGTDGTLDEGKFKAHLKAHIDFRYPGTGQLIKATSVTPSLDTSFGLVLEHYDAQTITRWSDYIINVVYDRYALDGKSYTIEFYLGRPTSQPNDMFQEQNFVGKVYTFGGGLRNEASSCRNCRAQTEMGVLSCGQVHLTIPLVHHAMDDAEEHPLASLRDKDVGAYLETYLHWRFVQFGGTVVSASRFPRTRIKVLRGSGERYSRDAVGNDATASGSKVHSELSEDSWSPMATYFDYVALPEVTDGKPWGLRRGGPRYRSYTGGDRRQQSNPQVLHLARL